MVAILAAWGRIGIRVGHSTFCGELHQACVRYGGHIGCMGQDRDQGGALYFLRRAASSLCPIWWPYWLHGAGSGSGWGTLLSAASCIKLVSDMVAILAAWGRIGIRVGHSTFCGELHQACVRYGGHIGCMGQDRDQGGALYFLRRAAAPFLLNLLSSSTLLRRVVTSYFCFFNLSR